MCATDSDLTLKNLSTCYSTDNDTCLLDQGQACNYTGILNSWCNMKEDYLDCSPDPNYQEFCYTNLIAKYYLTVDG
jgi:hypothetical protein